MTKRKRDEGQTTPFETTSDVVASAEKEKAMPATCQLLAARVSLQKNQQQGITCQSTNTNDILNPLLTYRK